MHGITAHIPDGIGGTALVPLRQVRRPSGARVLVELESEKPGDGGRMTGQLGRDMIAVARTACRRA